jgi:hypothetical protein
MYRFATILISLLLAVSSFAQSAERRWSVIGARGFIYAHTQDVENTRGAQPTGIQVDYAWRRTDSSFFKKLNGLPSQGISLHIFDYNNEVLGNTIGASYFIEPSIRFSKHTGIMMRAQIGFSYHNRPFHPARNPNNNSYSTHINSYLALGAYPYLQLNQHWQIFAGAQYRHISNAGLSMPNKGINWVTGELGIAYFPTGKKSTRELTKQYQSLPFEKGTELDVIVFGSVRSLDADSETRFGIWGLGLQKTFITKRTHAWTVGAEWIQDHALAHQISRDNQVKPAGRLGLLGGHQFVWGKLKFSQQLGIYAIRPSSEVPIWYHRWGLQYRIGKNNSVGVYLLAHRHVAQFPDIRWIQTIQRTSKQVSLRK